MCSCHCTWYYLSKVILAVSRPSHLAQVCQVGQQSETASLDITERWKWMMPRSEERITELGNNLGKMRTVFIIYSRILLRGEQGLHAKCSSLSCRNRKQHPEHALHQSSSFTFSPTFGQFVFPNDTTVLQCFFYSSSLISYIHLSALMCNACNGSMNTEGHTEVLTVCLHPQEIDCFCLDLPETVHCCHNYFCPKHLWFAFLSIVFFLKTL